MREQSFPIRPALVVFALMTLLTGVLYPLLVTGVSQAILPSQANGSVIERAGTPIGSSLIGQSFTDPAYFWGRPSATSGAPYTPFDGDALTGSSGSNLGPLAAALRAAAEQRIAALQAADPGNAALVPGDLVTASGSGLDPHISVSGAYYQAGRIAGARGLEETAVRALVDRYTAPRLIGIFGEPRVNVLRLNVALDELNPDNTGQQN